MGFGFDFATSVESGGIVGLWVGGIVVGGGGGEKRGGGRGCKCVWCACSFVLELLNRLFVVGDTASMNICGGGTTD